MKANLKNEYIKVIQEKLDKARISYEIAKKDTIEAEGRMITRYDSTKTETAWLADGYLKNVKELESIIEKLHQNIEIANFGDSIKVDKYQKNEFAGIEIIELNKELLQYKKDFFIHSIGATVNDSIIEEVNKEYVEYYVREIISGNNDGSICLNSLVGLKSEDGYIDYYYLVNYLGGVEINVDGEAVFCISKQTPIALSLLGRKVGDRVKPNPDNDFVYTVNSIEQINI